MAEQRARQAAGNEVLAAELARAEQRGLLGRLHALADAAELEPEPEPEPPPTEVPA